MWWFEYAWPIGSSAIKRGGLVAGSASLCRRALRSYAQAPPSAEKRASSWLPADQEAALPAPWLPGRCHVSCRDDNGLTLWPQLNVCL
ncbi:rCG42807, partial [Rattus norvegicus]